jgi:hypothetical protein
MDITTQRNSLEYNIDKYSGLSFMQRNSIRYEFIKIFKENIYLKIICFDKILPKYDNTINSDKLSLINNNRSIIGYDLHYTYKKDKYSNIQKNILFIPLYVYPFQLIKSMIFYYYLDKKNKKQEENEENIEIYFQDYNNYDNQFI